MVAVVPYILAAIVLAQCASYFAGLLQGRKDVTAIRDGVACFVFGLHAATVGVATLAGRGAPALTAFCAGISTVALLPAWIGASANRANELARFVAPASAFAAIGAIALAMDASFELPFLERPLGSHGMTIRVLIACCYLATALLAAGIATFVVLLRSRERAFARPHDVPVAYSLALTILLAVFDLVALLRNGGHVHPLVDLGLLLTGICLLDGTLLRLRDLGDELESKRVELSRSYAELHATQARIVRNEQLAAVGELSAVIAHEVRNPLAIIKNALSGLRRKTIKPESRAQLLDILEEETDKLNRLMHDLLAYARPVAPRLVPLRVEDLLRRAVERAFGGVSSPHGLEVEYDIDFDPEELLGDGDLLVHALVNVVENALQAMPHGGTLTLSTERAIVGGRDSVVMAIRDTGEGMEASVREKARHPFFTTRPTGTGLGLAIVERVVRNHGGHVDLESCGGEGTVVRLSLPLERTSLTPLPPPEARLGGIHEPGGLG